MSDEHIRPRFFWRRLAATLIDYALASLFVVLAAHGLSRGDVAFEPLGLELRSCGPDIDLAPETLIQIHQAIAPERIAAIGVCRVSSFGLLEHRVISVVFDVSSAGAITRHKSLSFVLSADEKRVVPLWPLDWAVLTVLIFVWSYVGIKTGASPGKAILGLRVAGLGAMTYRRRCIREALRCLPWVIVSLGMVAWMVGWSATNRGDLAPTLISMLHLLDSGILAFPPALWVSLGVAILVAVLWYYDWAMIRWRGQMRYDRMCKTWVERKGQ
jgi:hypothetical protein